jgi:hypothetical protein
LQKTPIPWQVIKAELLLIFLVVLILAVKSFRYVSDDTRLVLRGELDLVSIALIENALREHKGRFNTLQFEDSPGAGAAAGMIVDQVEALINRNHLNTEARGYCASACAAAFLLGENRTLLKNNDNAPTFLMIHAFRNHVTREVNYGKTEALNKKMSARSLSKLPINLLNRIFDDKKGTGDGEIYIFRDPQRTPNGFHHVFVCDGSRHVVIGQCEAIVGVTPEKLGIRVAK